MLNIVIIIGFLFFQMIRKISVKALIDRFINLVFKVFYAKGIPEKLDAMKKDILDGVP